MQITTATVRFMRRIQPQDYEPAEAEITATVAFYEDETSVESNLEQAGQVLKDIRAQVYATLNRAVPGEAVPPQPAKRNAATTTAAVAGAKPGKGTTKAAPTGAETADLGTTAAAAAPVEAKSVPVQEAAPAQQAPAVNQTMDVATLKLEVASLIKAGKLKPEDVKSFYPSFNINRLDELKPGSVGAFKVAIDHLLNSTKEAASDL